MTNKLIDLGYESIAFLCETNDDWTRGASRRKGFQKAMTDAGLSAHRMIRYGTPPMAIKDGYFIGKNLKEYYDDIDCVFCVSDLPAFGLLTALREEGVSVPGDVGITGFGDFEVSRFSVPTISTVQVDPVEVGHLAAQLVKDLLSADDKESKETRIKKRRTVDVSLNMRESTSRRKK